FGFGRIHGVSRHPTSANPCRNDLLLNLRSSTVYLKRDETREKEMAIKTVGIVGWRGMVGSVLMERMRAEGDFTHVEPVFFSTSQVGAAGPDVGRGSAPLRDASDISAFRDIDVVITCQGGDYTKQIHPQLRQAGFNGYWIDAASALRMTDNSAIILDPVNRSGIDRALERGVRDFIGGNCTVSLMLMAIGCLFEQGWVQWVNS